MGRSLIAPTSTLTTVTSAPPAGTITTGVYTQGINYGLTKTAVSKTDFPILASQYPKNIIAYEAVVRTLPSATWMSLAFGNGIFVAVASGGTAWASSPDGITWTQQLGLNSGFNSVTFGNGIFVAVAGGITAVTAATNYAAISSDGVFWTWVVLPVSADWNSVAYGNGLFVTIAGGNGGSTIAATSPDGITWTQRALPSVNYWADLLYANGLFIVMGGGGAATTAYLTSPDGITWTQRVMPASSYWSGIAYGNGIFVAVGNGLSATSPDGITWTLSGTTSTPTYSHATFANGVFSAMGDSAVDTVLYISYNGLRWGTKTVPSFQYHKLLGVNGMVFTVGKTSTTALSVWIAKPSGDTYNYLNGADGQFVRLT